jgi:hypothetical protein
MFVFAPNKNTLVQLKLLAQMPTAVAGNIVAIYINWHTNIF